ncbi:MAG TPA: alkaline phosphatase family protein [Candidatus Polarisedimenticolia bacterium]|nr:alkaline phosphatase family protein [Candidatus Polarisedimenticolia bacterium]
MKPRIGAALCAIVAIAAMAASVVHVPQGSLATLAWRGGGTPRLLSPGFSLRLPILQRVRIYPDGAVDAAGMVQAASREGSVVSLPYEATLRPGEQGLLTLEREGGAGGAQTALKRLVEEQIHKVAAALGTFDLASGAARQDLETTVRLMLEKRFSATARVTFSAPGVPTELRATFGREAIYGRRQQTGVKVVLVGIDGADWDAIDPLIAKGELPNLARLKREGSWARLRSNVPTLSPILWTTVATGKSPDRHGINDFLIADPRTGRKIPINSTFRRTKALWNILTEAGMSSDVIAWWASWPAEAISGHLISDRIAYSTFSFADPQNRNGAVYPDDYAATVERLRLSEGRITYREVAPFLRISESEFKEARQVAARKGRASEIQESINVFVRLLASTETYRRIALDLLDAERRSGSSPDLFAVYFQGVDETNHRFAHCVPPHASLCPPDEYARFSGSVAAFYRYQDEILGEILRRTQGATVIVISDHGFLTGDGRPRSSKPFIEGGNPGMWHDLYGVFLACGPPIRTGEIPPVTLYDIAPTILHLIGLPAPDDMPGKPLTEALTKEFEAAHPIVRVPSYEGLGPAPGEQVAASGAPGSGAGAVGTGQALGGAADEEMVEQLRSLGYVGGPGGGQERAAAPEAPSATAGQARDEGVPTILYHTNLARVYLGKRQFDLAETEYRKALQIDPRSTQALAGLAGLYELKGDPDKALEVVRSIVHLDSDTAPLVKVAELFIQVGRAADGLPFVEGIKPPQEGGRHWEVGRSAALVMLYSAAGRPREAEAALLKALALDPASVTVMQELFALYDGQGRAQALEPRIRAALTREPRSAMHHNWLALVLKRRGDLKGAEEEFRQALQDAPDLVGVMANLGSVYLAEGRPAEAVSILTQALEKDPRNVESRTNLIVALGMSHDLSGAAGQLDKAKALGQEAPSQYNALAYVLHLNGENDRALAILHESLKINPDQPDAVRLMNEIERGQAAPGSPYR